LSQKNTDTVTTKIDSYYCKKCKNIHWTNTDIGRKHANYSEQEYEYKVVDIDRSEFLYLLLFITFIICLVFWILILHG